MPSDSLHHRQSTGRFLATLMDDFIRNLTRQVFAKCELSCWCVVTVSSSSKCDSTARFNGVRVFVACLLLLCGDVESNPGPNTPTKKKENDENRQQHDSTQASSTLQQDRIMKGIESLSERMTAFENNQVSQIQTMKSGLEDLRDTFTARLALIDSNQEKLQSRVSDLQTVCSDLQSENLGLREELCYLKSKCDSLENHSRRNNLVFYGIMRESGPESWDTCEKKVKEVIRHGLGIEEHINIERAHRTGPGNAVIVKLLSYKQKMSILTKARTLKTSDRFKGVYINEDFSRSVRQKRRMLHEKAKAMFSASGEKTKMKFDKLITRGGVYTYDTNTEAIVLIQRRNITGDTHEQTTFNHDHSDDRQQHAEGAYGGSDRREMDPEDWNFNPFAMPVPDFPPLAADRPSDRDNVHYDDEGNADDDRRRVSMPEATNSAKPTRSVNKHYTRESPVWTRHATRTSSLISRPDENGLKGNQGLSARGDKGQTSLQQWTMTGHRTATQPGGRGDGGAGRGGNSIRGGRDKAKEGEGRGKGDNRIK